MSQKKFVRYNLEAPTPAREQKRAPAKKAYTQKPSKNRQCIREMLETFVALKQIPPNMVALLQTYPKFFSSQPKLPQPDSSECLNDCMLFSTTRKAVETPYAYNHKLPDNEEQDVPEWNSDEDVDTNLKSKKIDDLLAEEISTKYVETQPKKPQLLKRHEREFLEDYYRSKRTEEQEEAARKKEISNKKLPASEKSLRTVASENSLGADKRPQIMPTQFKLAPTDNKQKVLESGKPKKETEEKKQIKVECKAEPKIEPKTETEVKPEKVSSIWSQYQEKQVSSFVDLGMMTKIDENDQFADPFFNDLNDEFANQPFSSSSSKKSSSSSEDDVFGDEQPTTKTHKVQAVQGKQSAKGKVFINQQIFTRIAELVGVSPASCIWVITNKTERYRVSTQYMDEIYRQEKLFQALPFVSLCHSEFVPNEEIETEPSLQIFRKYNARTQKQPKIKAKKSYHQKDLPEKQPNKQCEKQEKSYPGRHQYQQRPYENKQQDKYMQKGQSPLPKMAYQEKGRR